VARAHPDLTESDLGRAILVPGFVDAHCHLEWSLIDGLTPAPGFGEWLGTFFPRAMRMTADDHGVAARLGALRCLEAGTTTVADSGPTGAGRDALRAAGLRGIVHLEAFGRETGVDAVAAAARIATRVMALDDGADALVEVGLSPHAPYSVGPGLWAALADHRELDDGDAHEVDAEEGDHAHARRHHQEVGGDHDAEAPVEA